MNYMPVFVFKTSDQVGNGLYSMTACFVALGVHVPFVFEAHSENRYLKEVQEPIPCDGSCKHYSGHIEDFSEKRGDSDHGVSAIIKKAHGFKASVLSAQKGGGIPKEGWHQ